MEGFKRGVVINQEGDVPVVPDEITLKQVKQPRTRRIPRMRDLIDKEIVLDREALLLATGEGLARKNTYWCVDLLKFIKPEPPKTKKKAKPTQSIPPDEQGRGLDSGVFDWDMLEAPLPDPAGVFMDGVSSSVVGGSPIPPSLGRTSQGGRISSPMVRMDWAVPSNVYNRPDSFEIFEYQAR